jgi:hypothetical protein
VYIYQLLFDVSGWAAVLIATSPCVGGVASISAASNQPVCVHLRYLAVPCANNIKQS